MDDNNSPLPSFHDGSLVALDLANKRVTASLIDYRGKPYVLSINGVDRFRVLGFSHPNLLGWLDLIERRKPPLKLLNLVLGAPSPLWSTEVRSDHRQERAEWEQRIIAGDAVLVALHGNLAPLSVGLGKVAELVQV